MTEDRSPAAEDLKQSIHARAEFEHVSYHNHIKEEGVLWDPDVKIHTVEDEYGEHLGDYAAAPDTPKDLHETIKQFVRTVGPEIGHCFHNALRFYEEVESAVYAEGHAINNTGDFHHAWNLVNGHLIDTTLGADAYYGVVIDNETTDRCVKIGHEHNYWGVFTNWRDDHQYLEEHVRE